MYNETCSQVPEPIEEIIIDEDNIKTVTVIVTDEAGKETKIENIDPKNPIVVEELPPGKREAFKNPKNIVVVPKKPRNPEDKTYTVKVKVHICEHPKTTQPPKTTPPKPSTAPPKLTTTTAKPPKPTPTTPTPAPTTPHGKRN